MDEEFYIEDNSVLKIVLTIIVAIALIIAVIYYYNKIYKPNYIKLNDITVELGDKLSDDIKDYITCNNYDDYQIDLSNIKVDENGQTVSTGEYSYKITGNNVLKKGKVIVKDTKAPIVTVQSLTVGVEEDFSVSEFVTTCEDLSLPCKVSYEKEKDSTLNKKAGEYTLNIIVTDMAGNETSKQVKLVVKENYTYKSQKEKDLEYVSTSNDEIKWNKEYTYKFDKALDTEEEEFDEKIKAISLDEYNFDKTITNKELLIIYNKYDYAIGITVYLTFEDGTTIFVTKDDIKTLNEDE